MSWDNFERAQQQYERQLPDDCFYDYAETECPNCDAIIEFEFDTRDQRSKFRGVKCQECGYELE